MIRSIIFSTVAVLMTAAGAHAAPAQVQVSTRGLDLSAPADARVAYRHLTRAAAEVCGGAPTYGDLSSLKAFDDCYRATLRLAVDRLDAPLVTALDNKPARSVRMARQ
jgi:UrcA family protein